MNRKLAIKGHSTRGKEVIELLEMMGGKNRHNLTGHFAENAYYLIGGPHNNEILGEAYIFGNEDIYWFTLEEFLKKYPFKVGDKVMGGKGKSLTIKSMSWSTDCETMVYDFEETEDVLATEDLLKSNAEFLVNKEKGEEVGKMLCDRTLNNLHRNHLKIVLSELYEHIRSISKEELEREFKEIESEGWTNVGPTVEEFMDFCDKVNKKPKYPDNYEECVRIAKNIHGYDIHIDAPAYRELMESLVKLLICQDAYWKIAGEEMGLGKPWEPNWTTFEGMPAIFRFRYNITCDYIKNQHCLLVFPTEEMRDAFYENFKDLIEQCKSLL